MFLTAGMRLVAATCVGLGIANVIGFVIYYLTLPDPQTAEVLHLVVALVIAQVGIVFVGVALFRFHKAGWFAFWLLGICSLALVGKLIEIHHTQTSELDSIPFVIGIEQALWFIASAVCLVLPSSRHCYFNITDQLWMHQKVLRHGEASMGEVSGRPRKPVGISVLAWLAILAGGLIFVSAMLKLAEPAGFNPEELQSDTVAAWKVVASVCIVVASTGLMRKKQWGWHAMLWCSILGILIMAWLWHYGSDNETAKEFHVTIQELCMALVWCGSAIFYLLLPVTRHAFFSRRRSRFQTSTTDEAG